MRLSFSAKVAVVLWVFALSFKLDSITATESLKAWSDLFSLLYVLIGLYFWSKA